MDEAGQNPNIIEDQSLTCLDCGRDFTFAAGEHRFYLSKGLSIPPKRCPDCRSRRRQTINRHQDFTIRNYTRLGDDTIKY